MGTPDPARNGPSPRLRVERGVLRAAKNPRRVRYETEAGSCAGLGGRVDGTGSVGLVHQFLAFVEEHGGFFCELPATFVKLAPTVEIVARVGGQEIPCFVCPVP